jgi:tRNA A-37 threonylcarbamoyl transferase component Bud32
MGNDNSKHPEKCVLNYTNGDKYEGEVLNGQRDGYGIYYYQNGDKYEGIWSKNKKHGMGSMCYKDGNMYIGQWQNSEKHGTGVFYYKTGEKYEGEFLTSKKNGKGKLISQDGSVFQGEFKDNRKHGEGIMTFSNKKQFKEVWENGILKSSKQVKISKITEKTFRLSNLNNSIPTADTLEKNDSKKLDNSFQEYMDEMNDKPDTMKMSTLGLAKYFKARIPNDYFDAMYFVTSASELIYENPHVTEWNGVEVLRWINLIGLSTDSKLEAKIKEISGVQFIKMNIYDIQTKLGNLESDKLKLIIKSIDFLRIFVKLKIDFEDFFYNQGQKVKERNLLQTEENKITCEDIKEKIANSSKNKLTPICEVQKENKDNSTANNSNLSNNFSFKQSKDFQEEKYLSEKEVSIKQSVKNTKEFDEKLHKKSNSQDSLLKDLNFKDKKEGTNIEFEKQLIQADKKNKNVILEANYENNDESKNDLSFKNRDSIQSTSEADDDNYIPNTREYNITKISITKLLLHSLNLSGFNFFINFDEIKILDKIGEGGFGAVYAGMWDGKLVAIKKFHIKEKYSVKSTLNKYIKEIITIANLRHPNIVLYMGASLNKNDCYMISEYITKGSLFDHLHGNKQTLSETEQISIAYEIAVAIKYLHSRKILHCDLKSSNILLDENFKVKIGDFGLSKLVSLLNESENKGRIGTPHWMAPEVMNKGTYLEASDVFSYGMILWEIISGEIPYYGMTPSQIIGHVADFKKIVEPPLHSNSSLRKLVKNCLLYEPNKRPTFNQIIKFLENALQKSINHDYISEDILNFLT